MGRGGPIYLSYTALALLSASPLVSAYDLWKVDIWEGPAPNRTAGPPFSANAIRNRAVLPYEIIGIVGAYVGSVLLLGTLLLTVGRKLRKKAQTMAAQPREMVKPLPRVMDPSPISPASQRGWYKVRGKKSDSASLRSGMSPGMDSVVSFDNTVVEADRARRQEEMERLYAAVMAQDERKSASQQALDVPPEYSGRAPPRLVTDNPSLRHLQGSGPVSPQTPKSPYRAIYPPSIDLPPGPQSPMSPMRGEYQNYSLPRESSADPSLRPTREARTPSFGSGQQAPPTPQYQKKLRKSLRNIKISGPIMKDDNSDGLRTPLSPRTYTDPGIPPEPPTAGTTRTFDSQLYPPTTPGTARTFPYPDEQPSPGSEEEEQETEENMDQIRALPPAHPQRTGLGAYNTTKPAASSTTNPLPFRELNRQYAAAQAAQAAAFPLSPGHWNAASYAQNPLASPQLRSPGVTSPGFNYLTSAGPVKTTFVDARKDRLGGGLRTGQATPYSPYMPFTPLTPVTPRLATRAERRQREREAKRAKGALTAEDAVVEEGEMWSSGY